MKVVAVVLAGLVAAGAAHNHVHGSGSDLPKPQMSNCWGYYGDAAGTACVAAAVKGGRAGRCHGLCIGDGNTQCQNGNPGGLAECVACSQNNDCSTYRGGYPAACTTILPLGSDAQKFCKASGWLNQGQSEGQILGL